MVSSFLLDGIVLSTKSYDKDGKFVIFHYDKTQICLCNRYEIFFIFAGYFYNPSKKAKKRCRELLQFFALTHKKDAGVMELSGGQVIEVEGAEPALMDYVKANRVEYDDLGDRVIVYTSVGSAPCDSIKDNFCSEKCVYRSSTLEDVFLRLTGRELRE